MVWLSLGISSTWGRGKALIMSWQACDSGLPVVSCAHTLGSYVPCAWTGSIPGNISMNTMTESLIQRLSIGPLHPSILLERCQFYPVLPEMPEIARDRILIVSVTQAQDMKIF